MEAGKEKETADVAVEQPEKANDATEPNALELGAAARAAGEEKLVDVENHAEPGQPAGAHLDAPAAGNTDPVDELVIEPGVTVALVSKGNEKLPVQLRDKAHLDELIATHGAGSVEVQS